MTLNTKQTKILARLKGKSARTFNRTKKMEPSAGGRLPPGINNGIGVLAGYIFDEQNGKPFIKLLGKVLAPVEFEGLTLKGKNATIRHDLCDMKNKDGEVWRTYEEAEASFLGDVQLLGVDTKELNSIDEVFLLLDELVEDKPKFVFHTWESKSGFVNTQLDGLFTGELDEDDEVYEEDPEEEEEDPEEEDPEEEEEDPSEYISGDEHTPGINYTVTGTDADAGDDDAIAVLTEKAGEYDIDPDDYETWLGLAIDLEAFDEAQQRDDEEDSQGEEEEDGDDSEDEGEEGEEAEEDDAAESDEDEGYIPEKGDIFGFTPKGSRKSIECTVTAVFSQKETVNLKALDSDKRYKSVPWDRLTIIDD